MKSDKSEDSLQELHLAPYAHALARAEFAVAQKKTGRGECEKQKREEASCTRFWWQGVRFSHAVVVPADSAPAVSVPDLPRNPGSFYYFQGLIRV